MRRFTATILLTVFVKLLFGQSGDNPINYDQTWKDSDVNELTEKVSGTSFPRQKLDILKKAIDTTSLGFTAGQTKKILKSFNTSKYMADAIQVIDRHILGMRAKDAKELLKELNFPSDKLRVLEVLRFTITDADNKMVVAEAFRASKHQDEARKMLKDVDQPRSFVYGTVKSKRVTFVVDVSGSMNTKFRTNEGREVTRLNFVKEELKKVLKSLDNTAKFNIIFFSDKVNYWKKSMMPARIMNVNDAVEFISKQKAQGQTNIYGALETAFDDPEVSTIYFLTDGQPTTGEETGKLAIAGSVSDWNENRGIDVNTTIFLTGENQLMDKWQAKSLMRKIARRTDGVYRCIDD